MQTRKKTLFNLLSVQFYIFAQSGIKILENQMIRKFLSILFAGLIIFNLFGYYFVFKCDQIRVKTEMKAMIRSGSFRGYEEITILNPATDRDFKMLDKDEIRYRGKLYDVISIRISGTSVIFRCINDTKEEQLLARYEKYSTWVTGMNLPERSKNSQAMLYHIIKHALLNKYSVPSPPTYFVVLFFEPHQDFKSVFILPSFPPPRFV
ncbi:MAG: hypothetical protein D4R97_03900 [Bacteroidetes bacterium]|nr:MAG: hypothetical protein D4R97_03900 [Bacteroidota bacterium]